MNPLQVPQQGSYEERGLPAWHIARLSKTTCFGFLSKWALPQGPLNGIPHREVPHHSSPPSFIHQSAQYMCPPHTSFPSAGKGPPWREIPASGDFLNISSRVPSEGAPLRPQGASSERGTLHLQSPLHPSLKVPGRWALLQVPQNGAPMERNSRLQGLFYISFRVPSKGALPLGSLHRAPTERDCTPRALSTIPQSPWWRSPHQVAQMSPHEKRCHPQSLPFVTFRPPSKGAPPSRFPITRPPFQLTLRVTSEWTQWHWRVMSVPWTLRPISFWIPRKEPL